jgi:uncharacterized Zn-binding protein involved in type VI secretion
MPGVVRKGKDKHIGHASSSSSPFHQKPYSSPAQSKVYSDGALVVVAGGKTGCGDGVDGKSSKVFCQGKGVHRKGDATTGHGSFEPNAAESGSTKVFAN